MKRTRNPKVRVIRVKADSRELQGIMKRLKVSLGRMTPEESYFRGLIAIDGRTYRFSGSALDEMDMVKKSKVQGVEWYRDTHRMNRYDYKK